MSRRPLAAMAALIAGSLFSQATPRADNTVHVAGTACRPRKADVSKTNYNNTSIVNEATSSATVVCPVQYQDDPFASPVSFEIFVIDRSTSSNISCTLFGFADLDIAPGNIFQEAGNSVGSGTAVQPLQTIDGNAFDIQGVPGLNFTFNCTLPSSSSSSNRSSVVSSRLYSW